MREFRKEYTRDTTLIIQQAWYASLEHHRDLLDLVNFKDKILTIHYLHNGLIEIWEDLEWKQALLDSILEKNRESSEWFEKYTKLHRQGEKLLRPLWERGYTEDRAELHRVVDHVFDTMYYFDWMYYPVLDERTPPAIREAADNLRVQDNYFDLTDRFFRESILHMYPHVKGFEQAILRSEIENPPSLEVLEERCKNFTIVGEQEASVETIDDFVTHHVELLLVRETPPTANFLKGQTGNKGKATGRVRKLLKKSEIGSVQEGEIILAAMTTPEFVPAMKKAAAIVTDEGGIMCHAAIVARELQKPCLIGTKFSTQMFADGDMVEVDADNGVVRKI